MRKLSASSKSHKFRVIAAVVGLATLCGFSAASHTFAEGASLKTGERLISIHDRGVEKGVLTTASTLRKALAEANISVDANDLVEPSLDAELVASNYSVNIYRARPVIVNDGALSRKILSAYQTPRQIAEHAGIVLHDEDKTAMRMADDMVSNGGALQLDVDRATAFTLVLYGKETQAYSQETTVAGMMNAKGINLSKDDALSVDKGTTLSNGMTVEIWRNGEQTISEEKDVPFETEKIQDGDREVGYSLVRTPGENGKKTVTYEVVMKNGIEESRKEIQSVVTKESKKQVEVVGAKLKEPTNPSEAAQLGHQMMLDYGFGEDQWSCLYNLWSRESGWTTTAANASGAYGIPQALPGSKMGAGWQTDARVQIQWGLGYIGNRYSNPCGAWSAFNNRSPHWY